MKERIRISRIRGWLLLVFVVVIVGALLIGLQWATFARSLLPEALEALESDELVQNTHGPWLIFSPAQTTPTTGFIFYPGGRIDPRGYASLMRAIASEG